ncbi:TetR/AcrR family transcriptional regulator [Frankia sp. CNm7]|uniref:TetR/AcrR family transcriptional regulator n=1 Tax=Frankia nepalensis TaxID=1836974 RepID=A0A937USU0_9ACTN|nr:TetR/AcrR family transcriptional regulator [Frankia nepalensis]MBL7495243.1 TetR/AcrR family transcriptional regulator [Frankia nepalensis]MBL7516382.1 TetR/AcrR family transcriptional regulator [Frankia nepalensis]MBL7521339.1 TetR/AcrR family transcriptional regulator [Frankia nepalensis]MBL7632458.1 TetR/AcrR family transcriptional regulator [Frankia nepalensis]
MTAPRRVGAQRSKTRATMLDRAERLMLDEGYAAVTYRALAARAGVTPGLVQYYFPTLDDLFLALVRRRTEQTVGALLEALETRQPLRALWEFSNNRTASALIAELTALANHRKVIRAEIASTGEKVRELVLAALAESPNDYTFPMEPVPPEVLVFLVTSLPRMVLTEQAVGMSTSHAQMLDFLEHYLDRVEPRERPADSAGLT